MKSYILFLLLGVVSVLGNPIDKQKNLCNEKLLSTETNEPITEVNLEDEILTAYDNYPQPNKVELKEDLPKPDSSGDGEGDKFGGGEVDIVIEETVTPLKAMSDAQNEIQIDADDYLPTGNKGIDQIVADRIKDEIMQTAAGFAPIPYFRKKNKRPSTRFPSRRHSQRYPYAIYRSYPFYYPYYRVYRPSSLRYY